MKPSSSSNSSQIIAKKVWSIIRIILIMVKKGISKSKLIMDLNLVLKRGNQLASNALNRLIIHHNSFICTNKNSNFISPKEYEFSCSNSPATLFHHQNRRLCHRLDDPTATVAAVHRVLEMLNANGEGGGCYSPVVVAGGGGALPGFGDGKSPLARQLRITDSPFPVKDRKGNNKEEDEEDVKVNKAADEFIKKFYKNLKLQKSVESPYHMWAR